MIEIVGGGSNAVMQISTRRGLEALPSGSIITWDRIPGDPTSTAVAFIHHEDEPEGRVVWISPGGWQPMSVEEAGIRFPVDVVQVADGHLDPPVFEAPQFPEIVVPDPDYRLEALHAAVHWTQPTSTGVRRTLEIAEEFEAWLRAEKPHDCSDAIAAAIEERDLEQHRADERAEVLEDWHGKAGPHHG